MKYMVSDLTGARLDAAVAKAALGSSLGDRYSVEGGGDYGPERFLLRGVVFQPSRSWQEGGPIIERERIHLTPVGKDEREPGAEWRALIDESLDGPLDSLGPTPLIAAMRAYVASKFGVELELP